MKIYMSTRCIYFIIIIIFIYIFWCSTASQRMIPGEPSWISLLFLLDKPVSPLFVCSCIALVSLATPPAQLYFFCHPLSRCVTDLFINIAFFCVSVCHNLIILCSVCTLGLLIYYEHYAFASRGGRMWKKKSILQFNNITNKVKLARVEFNEEHYGSF